MDHSINKYKVKALSLDRNKVVIRQGMKEFVLRSTGCSEQIAEQEKITDNTYDSPVSQENINGEEVDDAMEAELLTNEDLEFAEEHCDQIVGDLGALAPNILALLRSDSEPNSRLTEGNLSKDVCQIEKGSIPLARLSFPTSDIISVAPTSKRNKIRNGRSPL